MKNFFYFSTFLPLRAQRGEGRGEVSQIQHRASSILFLLAIIYHLSTINSSAFTLTYTWSTNLAAATLTSDVYGNLNVNGTPLLTSNDVASTSQAVGDPRYLVITSGTGTNQTFNSSDGTTPALAANGPILSPDSDIGTNIITPSGMTNTTANGAFVSIANGSVAASNSLSVGTMTTTETGSAGISSIQTAVQGSVVYEYDCDPSVGNNNNFIGFGGLQSWVYINLNSNNVDYVEIRDPVIGNPIIRATAATTGMPLVPPESTVGQLLFNSPQTGQRVLEFVEPELDTRFGMWIGRNGGQSLNNINPRFLPPPLNFAFGQVPIFTATNNWDTQNYNWILWQGWTNATPAVTGTNYAIVYGATNGIYYPSFTSPPPYIGITNTIFEWYSNTVKWSSFYSAGGHLTNDWHYP